MRREEGEDTPLEYIWGLSFIESYGMNCKVVKSSIRFTRLIFISEYLSNTHYNTNMMISVILLDMLTSMNIGNKQTTNKQTHRLGIELLRNKMKLERENMEEK